MTSLRILSFSYVFHCIFSSVNQQVYYASIIPWICFTIITTYPIGTLFFVSIIQLCFKCISTTMLINYPLGTSIYHIHLYEKISKNVTPSRINFFLPTTRKCLIKINICTIYHITCTIYHITFSMAQINQSLG